MCIRTIALGVIAAMLASCSGSLTGRPVPQMRSAQTIILQPHAPPDGGGGTSPYFPPGPAGTCDATSIMCIGLWDFGTPANFAWDPSGFTGFGSIGTGFWTFTIICNNPIDCAALGYPSGTISVINQHYNSNNPGIPQYNVGGGPDQQGVYSACVNDPDFGTSCSLLLANLGPAKPGLNCDGSAKSIGSWFNGTDTHANEIRQIYEVQFIGPGMQTIIGWVYETFGAGNFFQPNAQVSVTAGTTAVQVGASSATASVAIGTITGANIATALNAWFALVGIVPTTGNTPAFLLKAMARGSKVGAGACFAPVWDGTTTSGKIRRAW